MKNEKKNDTAIRCRDCKEESSIDINKENMGLEENDKVMARINDSTSPSTKSVYIPNSIFLLFKFTE